MTNLNKAELDALQASEKPRVVKMKDGEIKLLMPDGKLISPVTEETKSKNKKNGVISFEELEDKQKNKPKIMKAAKGGLAEATAKLKAKGLKEGGMVVKDKTVAIDKSPNSGLITQRGFGASRRT